MDSTVVRITNGNRSVAQEEPKKSKTIVGARAGMAPTRRLTSTKNRRQHARKTSTLITRKIV